MPNYDFKCSNSHITERSLAVEQSRNGIICPVCGEHADRIFPGPPGYVVGGTSNSANNPIRRKVSEVKDLRPLDEGF